MNKGLIVYDYTNSLEHLRVDELKEYYDVFMFEGQDLFSEIVAKLQADSGLERPPLIVFSPLFTDNSDITERISHRTNFVRYLGSLEVIGLEFQQLLVLNESDYVNTVSLNRPVSVFENDSSRCIEFSVDVVTRAGVENCVLPENFFDEAVSIAPEPGVEAIGLRILKLNREESGME